MIDKLVGYWHTAVADLRYQAFYVLCWRAFIKLISPLVKIDYQILYELDLTKPFKVHQARIDCEISQATEKDIDEILDMQMELLPPEAMARMSDAEELQYATFCRAREKAHDTYVRAMLAGERCFVARVNGRIAHSNWIRFHDNGWMEGRPVGLLPGEVYSTDGFTAEAWRGQRLHEAVATYQLNVCKELGCHHAYTITDLTKAGSRRGVLRIGWLRRGTILYVTPRLLGRTWLFRVSGDLEPMFRQAREMMLAS